MNDLLKTLGIPEKPVNPQRAVAQKQKELKSIVRAGKRPANPLEQIAYKAPGFKAPSGVSMPKPQPKPVARPYSDPLGMGIASLLQSQPPRVDTQMQAHIRRTQPVTANMGFAVGREESPSIEREMAEYDLRHFGRETYGEQPGDISDSDYAKRTLYRERITKRFGWDSSGRIAQEENLNREIEAHKPENMTPQQRLELVKEAAGGFNPLNVLAGPAAMIPGVHGYLDEGRDALAGKLLGENPNLANLDDAGLALNAINQAMSPVSTAKSVLGRDPRTMTELPDWEQAALTLGDIASQVGLGSLTGGTATGPALSRLGQGALKYLAMDVPGYVQMVRDSGGAENALKQYGGMIRDALDFTKNVPMSQRLQGAALAIAIAMSPAALAKGKVRPDATPPKITEQAPSVPESIPGVRGEMGGVGLDAEPPLRPGVQEPVAGGKAQKGAVKPDLAALTKEFDDLHPEPPPAKPAAEAPKPRPTSPRDGEAINPKGGEDTGSRAKSLAKANKWHSQYGFDKAHAGKSVDDLSSEIRSITKTLPKYLNDWDESSKAQVGRLYNELEYKSQQAKESGNANLASQYKSLAEAGAWPNGERFPSVGEEVYRVFPNIMGTAEKVYGTVKRTKDGRYYVAITRNESGTGIAGAKTQPLTANWRSSSSKAGETKPSSAEKPYIARAKAEISELESRKYKSYGTEKKIKRLNAKISQNINKFEAGQGVGWKPVDGQVNRGYRIVEVDANEGLAKIALIADDGRTTYDGSNRVPIGKTEVVELIDLVRDKRFDSQPRTAADAKADLKSALDDLKNTPMSGGAGSGIGGFNSDWVVKAGKVVEYAVESGVRSAAEFVEFLAKEGLNLTAKQKEGYTAAWEHHQGKKSEAPPVVKPPVVKPPKAIKPPEPQMTKPRQADVKSVADAIGLDLTKERKTVPEIAKAVEDGGCVESSAASAQKALDGKALNTEEQVGLAMGINNTKAKIKELDAALRKAKNAKNDVRAQEIIKLRDEQVQTHKLLLQGLQKARSESGRSLGAGSTFELADYAIPSDVITLAEAKVKGEIPEAKRKQLEADSERYAAMERDLKDAQESIKTSREREAALEKRLADAAIKRAPRAGKTGRIPVDAAKQALKELGAFEPVVGAMPVFSPKQSRAFSTLAKWAIGEVKTAGDVTTDAVVAKMRDLVEKNNVGHVLFDEDYYRAIRQALLGDKSGSYSGLLDDADTWLNQRARQFDETVSADKQSAKVQGDWDKAFKDADKKAEAQARAERLNDIKDAMDATPRNRNAEKLAQGLIKGGNKDFSAIVKAIQGKYKLTDIEAASSARRAVWSMEAGLQRRFGRDLMDASLDVRQKQAELKAIKDEIDYNIEKLSPQSLPTKLRVGLRAFAFSNPVNRVLDVAFNGLRLGAETVGKPVDAVLESAWMLALPKNARRSIAKPQFMATSRRALEASKAIKQGMWADAVQNFKFGDTALLEKQGFPKVGMNSKNEAVNKGFNFLARLPGYTDIPARRTWYEISLLELVDNEVDFMAKQNNWTPTQKSQHRKMMLDNANGELEPLRLAAANAADELVFANTTKFDKIISAGEQGLKKVIGESAGDWVMLGSDVFVTPYLRIFAKITGYGTDHLWGGLKAVTEAGTSKAKTGKVPAHVRRRVIELSRRQMFGLAIGYAATEWYKQAKQSENGKDQLDRYVQLKNGYVDIPEPLKASGVMTPFLLTIGLKRIDDSGGTPAQKDAWRKDLFSSLAIETPLMSGTSDLGRAISLQDDPLKFATRKIANAVIPGAVRQASKMMDREKDSQPWEMRERPVNTKPDTSNSLKTRKDGSTYISEKTWAEQDRLKSTVNELKARIPGLRNQLPTKK